MGFLEASKVRKLVYKKGDVEIHLEKEEQMASSKPEPKHHVVSHAEHHSAKAEEAGEDFVISPMVGTYYAAPAPDESTFVKVGDRVTEETVVCIVEAMKVMNEVKAGTSGVVAEILAENGQPVEYGTRLFRIQ